MTIKEFEIQLALGTASGGMKIALVDNPNTPKGILTKLSKDKDANVRYPITKNPNTPVRILIALSKDKHWWIRNSALKQMSK